MIRICRAALWSCCPGQTRWYSDMMNEHSIDLHIHSTISDGTDTPEELLCRVRDAGIGLFSLTDHDAAEGCVRIRQALRSGDPHFLNGVEFSCRDVEGKYHILGYGYDPDSASMRHVIEKGHLLRMKKTAARLDFICENFGFTFPENEKQNLLALSNPGKPHIGNLMVKYGYAGSKEEAIDKYINQARVPGEYIRPEEAIEGILQGDGIPVLAHPPYGSGDELIIGEEMERRLRRLIGFGLRGMECFYSVFTPKLCGEMLVLAEKYALYITAGSDYHGKNKLVRLGRTNYVDALGMPEGMKRFLKDVTCD